jgi:hypothetical protein
MPPETSTVFIILAVLAIVVQCVRWLWPILNPGSIEKGAAQSVQDTETAINSIPGRAALGGLEELSKCRKDIRHLKRSIGLEDGP